MWLNELYQASSPIALELGPLVIRWYGIAYMVGFVCAGVVIYRNARRWGLDLTADDVLGFMISIAFGVIIGGRLGYILFYGAGYYLAHPLEIVMLNQGGMSFHGGLVGAIVAGYIESRRERLAFPTMADLAVCGAPIGLFLGRCANFVNGELWGKECDLPWGVMFADAGGGEVFRHPSQLYEALLEGVVLFCILYALSRRVPARPQGSFLGTFLACYGCFRFLIEFVRLPDSQLGYLLGTSWLTMGMCLSLPLVVIGVALIVTAHRLDRSQVGHLG